MKAAVGNFVHCTSTVEETAAHITRRLVRMDARSVIELGGCLRSAAASIISAGGNYACVLTLKLTEDMKPGASPPDGVELIDEDPDWWCGRAGLSADAALIRKPAALRRLDQLFEVLWAQLAPGAALFTVGGEEGPHPRTLAQLHTSLVEAGFAVAALTDTREGVVFRARRI